MPTWHIERAPPRLHIGIGSISIELAIFLNLLAMLFEMLFVVGEE